MEWELAPLFLLWELICLFDLAVDLQALNLSGPFLGKPCTAPLAAISRNNLLFISLTILSKFFISGRGGGQCRWIWRRRFGWRGISSDSTSSCWERQGQPIFQGNTVGIRLSALQLTETSSYRTFTSPLTEWSRDKADHSVNKIFVRSLNGDLNNGQKVCY